MDKNKKGLADTGEGEFILNESGTSVSTDKTEGEDRGADQPATNADEATQDERIDSPRKTAGRDDQ